MADLKFAQEQVRNFAQIQRDSMLDVEVETCQASFWGIKIFRYSRWAVMCRAANSNGGLCPYVSSDSFGGGCAAYCGSHPAFQGRAQPAVIAAMHLGGAHEIYVLGGIQAVGAMAVGTQTIEPVHMLVRPGNAYVAEAKRQLYGRVGIDLFAGPTETMVIAADESVDAEILRNRPAGTGRAWI